jgi:phage terminase large subunit-like protein
VLDPWQRLVLDDILGVREDGMWAAFETCTVVQRQNGKGAIIEAIELAGLFLLGEYLILHSAHEYKTAQEAFLRIKALIEGCPDLSRHVKVIREANGEQQVILMSGARLRFVARSKGSGRGFSGQRNILDESFALTRTQLAALLPTMSAQQNPQMNLFSTVPDADTAPAPEEAVLPMVHERAVAALESGRPGRLAYHDWSAPRGVDPTDPQWWYETNPALGIRIAEDYVAAEAAALGERKFGTERLGIWDDPKGLAWLVIPKADWLAAEDPDSSTVDPVAFAVTMSTGQDRHVTIAAAGRTENDLLSVSLVDRRAGTGWVIPRLTELVEKWRPCGVVIDKGSPAGSLAAEAEEAGLELTPIATRDVAAAAGAFFDGIAGRPAPDPITGELGRDPRVIRHRGQVELSAAVAGAVKRPLSSAWAWDQLAAAVDISPLIAVSNALWAFRTRVPAGFFGFDYR